MNTISIPVRAVDDSVFDERNSGFTKFDSVLISLSLYPQVLLLDKSYNTESLAHAIKKVLTDSGACLTLQNGMGNVEILQVAIPPFVSPSPFSERTE